uniref:Uncharacterized protein n=1 Tax=Solanum lycopersicum TaxID=4081 RepID=K4DE85_SOLLC
MGGKSTPHMVEVSNEEGNDGHQATSPIQMEFVNNYQNIGIVDFDDDNQTEDTLKNHQVMTNISELQSPNANSHHTDETCEHSKIILAE